MRPDRINIGDRVAVNFHGAQFTLCNSARVKYIPAASGDSWVFIDEDTAQIHYISEGCTVTKLDS